MAQTQTEEEMCAICLGSMKAGEGQPLFTAECSHIFHYTCIVDNVVQHGNRNCPICRVTWRNPPGICLPYADDEPLPTTAPSSSTTPAQQGSDADADNMTVKTFPEYPALSRSDHSGSFAVLVGIQAPALSSEASDRAPIDLVAVLDVSGSMDGNKIRLLKQAVEFVIKNLGPNDRLSVITFSTSAQRVTPLRRMTDERRDSSIQAVKSLSATGCTNIIAGLKMAAEVLEQRRHKNPVSSIILLSDGQDNQNGDFYHELSLLPSCIRSKETDVNQNDAVPVHTFGFGSNHDAIALYAIADGSHGTFSYIESIEVIQEAFAMCLGGLLSVVAQQVEIQVDLASPEVRIQSIPSGRHHSSIGQSKEHGVIYVGDVYAQEEKLFLVYVSIPPADVHDSTSTTTQLLSVKCSYKDPLSMKSIISETVKAEIRRPTAEDLTDDDKKLCREVERVKQHISVTEGIAEAQAMADRGELQEARSLLLQTREGILQHCCSESEELLADEVDEIQELMSSKKVYEDRGRGYAKSVLLCHRTQRASPRVTQAVKNNPRKATGAAFRTGAAFITPPMEEMVKKSLGMHQGDENEAKPSKSKKAKTC